MEIPGILEISKNMKNRNENQCLRRFEFPPELETNKNCHSRHIGHSFS